MKTPKLYSDLLKKKQLTTEMIAECIYSVNKRAKNYRDKVREYRKSPYHPHLQDNIDNAIAKKLEYYGMKEELLKPFAPTVIHKQFVKNTKRVYSYEEDYQKILVEKKVISFGKVITLTTNDVQKFTFLIIRLKIIFISYIMRSVGLVSINQPVKQKQTTQALV